MGFVALKDIEIGVEVSYHYGKQANPLSQFMRRQPRINVCLLSIFCAVKTVSCAGFRADGESFSFCASCGEVGTFL